MFEVRATRIEVCGHRAPSRRPKGRRWNFISEGAVSVVQYECMSAAPVVDDLIAHLPPMFNP